MLTLVERPARGERMTSVTLGARADGLVVFDTAFGPVAASSLARVDTLEIETSLARTTFLVLRAFRIASAVRFTQEVGRARTDCAMVLNEY